MPTITRFAATALLAALLLSGCGGRGTDHDPAPTSAPPDPNRAPAAVRWQSWQGVRLPISAEDGPTKSETPAATGYTRTPQGAALAAIQHTVRMSIAPDQWWPEIANRALVTNPGKDQWVLGRARFSITGPADPKLAPRIRGYKVTTWNAERAEIAVYTSYSDDSVAANATVVSWVYGDWRLVLPDPSDTTPVVTAPEALPTDIVRLEAP